MATSTTKLGLTKPDFVDVVDITDLNSNADKLDSAAGFTVCTNATRPASPFTGQSIFETDTGDSFIWDGAAWQPGGGGGSIEISATAPASPAAGDLWWDSDNGNLYIYYTDVDSSQWVAANGPQVFVGTTAPAGYQGQLWFDSTTGKVYIYYDDGTSSQWVSAIGGSIAGTVLQVVSTTKTDAFTTTTNGYVDITGLSATITPSSTASKIYVLANVYGSATSSAFTHYKILRNGSDLVVGTGSTYNTTGTTYVGSTDMQNSLQEATMQFLDSPSSTSALTYKVQFDSVGQTGTINRRAADTYASAVSTITLMEVAG